MFKGFLIDAKARTIEPIEYDRSSASLRRFLPGGICIGIVFPNDDVLYVDDKALLKPASVAFRIKRRPDGQPMMSDGILTGRDYLDSTLPPEFTAAQLQAEIEWLDLDQALAWFRAKADQPAVTSTARGRQEVHAHWGDLLRNLEGGNGWKPAEDAGLASRL